MAKHLISDKHCGDCNRALKDIAERIDPMIEKCQRCDIDTAEHQAFRDLIYNRAVAIKREFFPDMS